jgi:hypothetical protein
MSAADWQALVANHSNTAAFSKLLPPANGTGRWCLASVYKIPTNRVTCESLQQAALFAVNPNNERLIQCPYCLQKYLLVWDDREWNFVQECAFASKVDGHRLSGQSDDRHA